MPFAIAHGAVQHHVQQDGDEVARGQRERRDDHGGRVAEEDAHGDDERASQQRGAQTALLALVVLRHVDPGQQQQRHEDAEQVPHVERGGRVRPVGYAVAQHAEHKAVDDDFDEEPGCARKRRLFGCGSRHVVGLAQRERPRRDALAAVRQHERAERQHAQHGQHGERG